MSQEEEGSGQSTNGDGAAAVAGVSDGLRSLATLPLTDRVREEIARSIAAGVFESGWLPAEPELAQQLSVSRPTVRSALRSLEEEGVISRQRGRGTRINTHVSRSRSLTRVVGFYDLIREAGATPGIDMTTLESGTADETASERMRCDESTPVVILGRRFLFDGKPAVYLREMVRADALRRVVARDQLPPTIFEFAREFCHWNVDHTVMELRSAVAGDSISKLLAVASDEAYLRLVETHYSSDGLPFIVSDIAVLDRYIQFIVVRRTTS